MAVTPAGNSSVPHKRPHPLNARCPILFKPLGSWMRNRYFFWVKVYSGITVVLLFAQINSHKIGHIITYYGEVSFVQFSFYGQEIHIFRLQARSH